mgnify:CR=1 FL=1
MCIRDRPITIFDPNDIWKKKTLTNFRAEKLQVQIFKKGVQCYTAPSLEEIRSYSAAQMDTLWDEIKRFEYPPIMSIFLKNCGRPSSA